MRFYQKKIKKDNKMKSGVKRYYNEIIAGTELYGDNFTFEEIKEWYSVESLSYEEIIDNDQYIYHYHYFLTLQIHQYLRPEVILLD